ncbi:capsular polysaccharide synthesis protein [Cronobacter sakazakii]|uniref:Capsular biosynthesis protein n=2 Tax=Cronobacter sakazakii TaxID=28141 RepID=A0AA45C2H2_CROSK|nr:capsular polysaccharide synthesis protein [Cronobacter sakazakii]EIZ8955596.1 capsular polysaccharide synthesis protein [Cronobacter sakazakii]EJJ0661956.1 capsular polysaccharide synthesis protein [Cronobacter sakazakii]EJJ0670949.1 capsular polysaccharide synthesis protein [Cronobacter sakazakii]EKC6206473.1 capsular polysaccharide synthesis protein [Cronobacter sakazakii]EKD3163636.1 capsular polysaccharide synthesis protein [Cronobacter sakazakii]
MKLNTINKLIRKSRRWHKKTGFSVFQYASKHFEKKKKATIFSVIDSLNIQAAPVSQAYQAQSRVIWICWFQGLEHAPELVKRCIESVKYHTPDANVIVLNDENIPDYLNLPEYITTKYQAGLITKAQYSDIVRCSLLYQYGGIWMDATVFMTRSLPESFYENKFSSLRFRSSMQDFALSQGYWTAYFLAAQKNNSLIKLVRDILYRYWEEHDNLIEYFLIDYTFLYVWEHFPEFREMMNTQPVTGDNRFLIRRFINSAPTETALIALKNDPVGIYKLSHKEKYQPDDNGQPTLYSLILNGNFRLI